MSPESLIALIGLAFTAAFTPGPNNALVASSGANFGYRRTLPHVLGIAIGFPVMVLIVGFFLGEAFQRSALLRETLRYAGAALLLFLAWSVARSGGLSKADGDPRPFTFVEAAAFQWVNPKAWAIAIAVTAQFVDPAQPLRSALTLSAVFGVAGFTSASSWTMLGQGIAGFLSTPRRIRAFNLAMAVLIAGFVALLFADRM